MVEIGSEAKREIEDIVRKANVVFNTVVKPHVQNALKKASTIKTQKVNKSCNNPI